MASVIKVEEWLREQIENYVILGVNFYTIEEMEAHKSLQIFHIASSGWVQEVFGRCQKEKKDKLLNAK